MTDVATIFANADRAFLKPADDRTVRKLDKSFWNKDGEWAENTLFVRRRIDDGDLIVATPPAEPAAKGKGGAAAKES